MSPPSFFRSVPSVSDPERLAALRRYEILDTPPEESFDRIARLAADLFDTPMALISLVAEDRQWFKCAVGLDEPETELEAAFCVHALGSDTPTVIEDATQDRRVANSRLVTGAPGLRFYAGTPLVTPDGYHIGTLSVLDTEPRDPSDKQLGQLKDLAAMVIDELELRREIAERERAEEELRESRARWRRLVKAHRDPIQISVDGVIRYVNPAGAELFGAEDPEEVIGRSVFEFAPDETTAQSIRARKKKLDRGEPTSPMEHEIERLDGERRIIVAYSVPIEYEGERAAQTVLRDVTVQRRTEKRLEEREREYRRLVESARDIICRCDLEGRLTYVNPIAEEATGYDREELIGRHFTSLVREDYREDLVRFYQRQIEEEISDTHQEFPMVTAEGEEKWISQRVQLAWEEGEIVGMQAVARNVTARRRAEERLRRSRERWQQLVENQHDAIYIAVDGQIRYINPAGLKLLGATSQAEIVGRSVGEFLTFEEATAEAAERIERVQRGETVSPNEYEVERLDGERRIVESYAVSIEYKGEPAVQGVVHDVTEQRRAERAHRESEARLRGLANSVPGMIFQFYARPDGEYGLHFVSEQSRSLFGLDPEPEGYFERFTSHVAPSHREEFLESVDEVVENVKPWNFEMPFVKPSGGTIWVHGIATPEERSDELIFNGVILDITKRRQLEAQLRQAQKMETVGTLAGGIAHDFNNILHAALAYVTMGLEDLPDGHASAEFFGRAEKGLKRAENLVDRLLTFSRQEGETVKKPVDVSAVIQETMALVESSVPSDVQVRTQLEEDCRVLGDPGQLQQVAMNLLTNAAQAMKGGESPNILDVEVRRMDVDADLAHRYLHLEPGGYVRLSVSDTGPGMDRETRERIFEPFFTTKEVGEGTGLGLSVVHGIVQAHNGEITVRSEPGEGSTFNVYIPSASEREVGEQTSGDEGPSGHILFVDDDEQVLALERVRLRGLGYEVTTRPSARAALEALESAPERYDLVLTDYAMPGMNGLSFICKVQERGHEIPTLLMSGFSARVSEEDVLQAGAEAFLRKPVPRNELAEILREALS